MKSNYSKNTDSIKDSTSREKVLKRVRHALLEPSDNPFPGIDMESSVYVPIEEEKDIQFAYELSRLGAKFIYCQSPSDMLIKVKALFTEMGWDKACCNDDLITGLLEHAGVKAFTSTKQNEFYKVSVTGCECLIARTGSILISSEQASGRKLPFMCDTHVVIAFTSQVVLDIKQAFEYMRSKYSNKLPSMVSIISGTGRSDDIEKIMVPIGHGPGELYVFMADEESTDN